MPHQDAFPEKRRRRLRWWLGGIGLILLLLIVDYYAYPMLAPMGGHSSDHGENGLWLRYSWYFGEWNTRQMDELLTRLHDGRFHDAYFHVRYIQRDGQLHFRYADQARRLVKELHKKAPAVRVFAWVYVGSAHGNPPVDIGNTDIRRRVIHEARWLVRECGFDGIQWDYEVCKNGDRRLITLLRDTRATLPGTPISVCAPLWLPTPIIHRYGWSEDYFTQVAAECDQIAVMDYDSGMLLPRAYVWLTRAQVVYVTRAVAKGNPNCRVLIGVPTYEAGGPSHNPHAENLRLAIKGVREGLTDKRTVPSAFAGIAPFADYTTSKEEWREYQRYWVEDAD